MNQGKFYPLLYFKCNNCQKTFYNTNAYSPSAINLAETYCVNCANWKYFNLSFKTQSNNFPSLFSKPVHSETNSNLFKPTNFNNLDNQTFQETIQEPRQKTQQTSETIFKDKRITGRTKQLNLRVKEKTYWKLKELALKNKCLMTEMLEKLLEGKSYKVR